MVVYFAIFPSVVWMSDLKNHRAIQNKYEKSSIYHSYYCAALKWPKVKPNREKKKWTISEGWFSPPCVWFLICTCVFANAFSIKWPWVLRIYSTFIRRCLWAWFFCAMWRVASKLTASLLCLQREEKRDLNRISTGKKMPFAFFIAHKKCKWKIRWKWSCIGSISIIIIPVQITRATHNKWNEHAHTSLKFIFNSICHPSISTKKSNHESKLKRTAWHPTITVECSSSYIFIVPSSWFLSLSQNCTFIFDS